MKSETKRVINGGFWCAVWVVLSVSYIIDWSAKGVALSSIFLAVGGFGVLAFLLAGVVDERLTAHE